MDKTFDLSLYQKTPLSAEREHELAVLFYEKSDLQAAHELVVYNLRFVAFVARGYRSYGLNEQDLMQEGAVGLMKAVKKFNPYQNVRLISFAVHWIRAEIHEYIIKNWKIVKIATTKAQRKLFFKLRSATKDIENLSSGDVHRLAKEFNVNEKDVVTMHQRLNGGDVSLSPMDDESEGMQLVCSKESPETFYDNEQSGKDQQQAVAKALSALDKRSRNIVQARWLQESKATLKELSKEYGISIERVRQIEEQAFQKMRPLLKNYQ